jgi:hypothetical protein
MKTLHIDRPAGELGTVWFVIPLLWAAVALIGFALIAHWPGLFAQELPAPAGTAVTTPAASDDSPVPSASMVFKDGTSYEAAQHLDTF